MSAAIAALLAALAVVYKLSITVTMSPPQDTLLNVLLDIFGSRIRVLNADEAATVLVYAVVTYAVVFSIVFFVLRFLAVFAAAFGIPDEQTIRLTRALRRNRGALVDAMRRQARFTSIYTVRAQQAAIVAQRQRQAQEQRRKTGQLPPLDPDLSDFGLPKSRG